MAGFSFFLVELLRLKYVKAKLTMSLFDFPRYSIYTFCYISPFIALKKRFQKRFFQRLTEVVFLSLPYALVSRLFLVIEYVNGGDLMFHMQRQRKLPEEHAR